MTLIRLPTVLAAMATVLAGSWMGAQRLSVSSSVLALAMGCIVALAQVFNDVVDFEADAHRQRSRPLHRGRVSERAAIRLCYGLALAGLLLLLLMREPMLLLQAEAMSALSLLYSLRLKNTVALGNAVTASLSGLLLPLGAEVPGSANPTTWIGAGIVALSMFLYEIAKAIRDGDSDATAGLATVGTRLGHHAQVVITSLTCVLLVTSGIWLGLGCPASRQWLYWSLLGCALTPSVLVTGAVAAGSAHLLNVSLQLMRYGRFLGIAALLVVA